MQPHPDKASTVLIDAIRKAVPPRDLMIFPEHREGHHVPPIQIGSAPVYPQVLGALPLQKEAGMPRP